MSNSYNEDVVVMAREMMIDDPMALFHSGIKGRKGCVRRYQNDDGSLTDAGKKQYSSFTGKLSEKNAKTMDERSERSRASVEKEVRRSKDDQAKQDAERKTGNDRLDTKKAQLDEKYKKDLDKYYRKMEKDVSADDRKRQERAINDLVSDRSTRKELRKEYDKYDEELKDKGVSPKDRLLYDVDLKKNDDNSYTYHIVDKNGNSVKKLATHKVDDYGKSHITKHYDDAVYKRKQK